jgi:hypothetical protein
MQGLEQRTLSNLRRLEDAQIKIDAAQKYMLGLEGAQLRGFGLAQGLQARPKRGVRGLGLSFDVGGYDLLDTDTYTDAWDNAGDAVGGVWDWLEDLLEYAGDRLVDIWDRLASVVSAIKQGFTSLLDIAYVTADGVAEMWALYKWVGGRDEYIELQQARDNWLIKKKENSRKYGPYYMKATDGTTKPADFPRDAKHATLITKEQATRLQPEDPDFKGSHNLLGVAQATWKYYLGGHDGIVPDWKNPLDYPNAVLYWYYDSQLNKIEAISANFNFSKMGQTRNWLFERGLLIQAWMSGGWSELYNLKNIIDQNYKVARARVDLIGHETAALVPGVQSLLNNGDVTPEQEEISILGIKSAKQLGIEKGERLRQMFPYNAAAYMGPQMWFLMHDFRHKMREKDSTPYPLICLEDKISDPNYTVIKAYLEKLRDDKIAKANELQEEARNNPNTTTGDNFQATALAEASEARTAYNNVVSDIDNMPLIFVEGMMSAFGGRAGPYYILDADNQFGDYPWLNRDAFAIGSKPDRPASVLPGFNQDGIDTLGAEMGVVATAYNMSIPNGMQHLAGGLYNRGRYGTPEYGKIFPDGLPFDNETITRKTGRIGSSPTLTLDWFSAQADWNTRGWGWGTQIFNPAKMSDINDWFSTEKTPTLEHTNLGKMFDWHPFDALWCHDGQTHLGGQFAVSHNAVKQSVNTKDWGVSQNELHGVYVSDWWNWSDSLLIEPLGLHGYGWNDFTEGKRSGDKLGGHKTFEFGATNFMVRRNYRIGSMADQGKHLFSMNWDMQAASEVPNIKQSTSGFGPYSGTTEGSLMGMPLSGRYVDRRRVTSEFNPIVQSSGNIDMSQITTGVRGAVGIEETYGLWNLNQSPVQSVFATGIIRKGGRYETHSLWKATTGKRFAAGPSIGHGRVKEVSRRISLDNRTAVSDHLIVEGLTNFHTISQRTFHPIAAVQESQSKGREWGWPSAGARGSNNYAPRGIMKRVGQGAFIGSSQNWAGRNYTRNLYSEMLKLNSAEAQDPAHQQLARQITKLTADPNLFQAPGTAQADFEASPLWLSWPKMINTGSAGRTALALTSAYSHYYNVNPNFQKTIDFTNFGYSVLFPKLGMTQGMNLGISEPSATNNFTTGHITRKADGDDGTGVMSYKVTPPVESTGFVGLSPRPGALQVNNAGASPWSVLPKYGGGRIPGGNHPSNNPIIDATYTPAADSGYATLDWSSPWTGDIWTNDWRDGESYKTTGTGVWKDVTNPDPPGSVLPSITAPLIKSSDIGTWTSVRSDWAETTKDVELNSPEWSLKHLVSFDRGYSHKNQQGTTAHGTPHRTTGWFGVNFKDITDKASTPDYALMQNVAFGEYSPTSSYTEPILSTANFNIASIYNRDITEIAMGLKMTWSIKPESHIQLAKVIKHILANRTCYAINLDGIQRPSYDGNAFSDQILPETQEFKSGEVPQRQYDGGWLSPSAETKPGRNIFGITASDQNYAELAKPTIEEVQGWSVPEITNAFTKAGWCPNMFGNDRLWESLFLAEPDNNPMGMWFDTRDVSNAFFGITDINKLMENGEVLYKKEDDTDSALKLMNLGEFWNLHRGLKNKDRSKYGDDLVDWFNSKVTKYGWCHIMQGTKPVRLDKFKEAQILPRYWAPLFVPYRSVNDMAPRLYFGKKVMPKTVGGGIMAGLAVHRTVKDGQISEDTITSLGFRKITSDTGRIDIPSDDAVDFQAGPNNVVSISVQGSEAYTTIRPWTGFDPTNNRRYFVWPTLVKTSGGKWKIQSPWFYSDNGGAVQIGTTNYGSNVQSNFAMTPQGRPGLAPKSTVQFAKVGGTEYNSFREASGKLFGALYEHYYRTETRNNQGLRPAVYPYQEADDKLYGQYGTTDAEGSASSQRTYDDYTLPWVRDEIYAAAPYDSIVDDNRLLGPFALQGNAFSPGETADMGTARFNLTDTHWAAQFSWLNCGWFGFNTIEEAELFLSNQFKQTTVSNPDNGATFDWKGVLNGPPTGTIGFGPIDDLIDFIRNWDTMIMEKIDLERMYQGVLNKYTSAKMQFDKIADFDLRTTIEGITDMDILTGYAKVIPSGNNTPKTYRWIPVFGRIANDSKVDNNQYGMIELHPDNAPIIREYIEASNGFGAVLGSDAGLVDFTQDDTNNDKYWPAAVNSPSKFVVGVYIEKQNQNLLAEDEDWTVEEFVPVQGIEFDGTGSSPNNDIQKALEEFGYPNCSDETLMPWVVDGNIVKTEVDITGGVFQKWSDIFSSTNSPLGRFMSKIRSFENGIRSIWSDKIPGFNVSMKNFWGGLGEENNVLSQFLRDVVELTGNFRKDYTGIATSAMNINEKVETYLDRFEQMSVNWSNSIQAMNKYADYMANTLYSMNQKFGVAIDTFRDPYQQFQDVITSESAPGEFNKIVQELDKIFTKGEKMNQKFGHKIDFSNFKSSGNAAKSAGRAAISAINNSGLAEIDLNRTQGMSQNEIVVSPKPWLEVPAPPSINLNFDTPPIRPWVDEPENEIITPDWGQQEFFEDDLDSQRVPEKVIPIIDPTLRRPQQPPWYGGGKDKWAGVNRDVLEKAYRAGAVPVNFKNRSGSVVGTRRGDQPYSTFPTGNQRTVIGYGPNGQFTTYFGDEIPQNAEVGDRWHDSYSGNLFEWNGEQWVMAEQQIIPITQPGGVFRPIGPGNRVDDQIIIDDGRFDIADQFKEVVDMDTMNRQQANEEESQNQQEDENTGNTNQNIDTGSGTNSGGTSVNTGVRPSMPLNGPLSYRHQHSYKTK